MGVSKNRGAPKSSILIGFSIINHPFWGTPIFWKHPNVKLPHEKNMSISNHFCERRFLHRNFWGSRIPDNITHKNMTFEDFVSGLLGFVEEVFVSMFRSKVWGQNVQPCWWGGWEDLMLLSFVLVMREISIPTWGASQGMLEKSQGGWRLHAFWSSVFFRSPGSFQW